MPLLALLVLACQITCGLHVVRSGQERYWIYLIIALPGLGCLIYFLGIMLPDILGSHRSRRTLNQLHDRIDPERHLRDLRDQLEVCDSREARMNLADELLRLGLAQEAESHYQAALRGTDSDAPDILLGLSQARLAQGDAAGCRQSLERLIAQNPSYRSAQGHLLYAQALDALDEPAKAEHEYQALIAYYPGPEAAYRYALLLRRLGRIQQAIEQLQHINNHAKRSPKHYRNLHQHWLKLSQQELSTLQQNPGTLA